MSSAPKARVVQLCWFPMSMCIAGMRTHCSPQDLLHYTSALILFETGLRAQKHSSAVQPRYPGVTLPLWQMLLLFSSTGVTQCSAGHGGKLFSMRYAYFEICVTYSCAGVALHGKKLFIDRASPYSDRTDWLLDRLGLALSCVLSVIMLCTALTSQTLLYGLGPRLVCVAVTPRSEDLGSCCDVLVSLISDDLKVGWICGSRECVGTECHRSVVPGSALWVLRVACRGMPRIAVFALVYS
jgi:hypothetical protein